MTLSSSIPLSSPGPILQASSGGPELRHHHHHHHHHRHHHPHLVEGVWTLHWRKRRRRAQNSKRGGIASSLADWKISVDHRWGNVSAAEYLSFWIYGKQGFKTLSASIDLAFSICSSRVVTGVISEFTFQDISPSALFNPYTRHILYIILTSTEQKILFYDTFNQKLEPKYLSILGKLFLLQNRDFSHS